jgi:hypothetical protein
MPLFAVNIRCRDQEAYQPRWVWEVLVEPLHTSAFIAPLSPPSKPDEAVIGNRI